jgi:DNA-binding CsgD family transcriptional regulator
VNDLTPREREVLALLARGYTNKEIAHALAISDVTVNRHHNALIYEKLGVTNRTEAVIEGLRLGLVQMPDETRITAEWLARFKELLRRTRQDLRAMERMADELLERAEMLT